MVALASGFGGRGGAARSGSPSTPWAVGQPLQPASPSAGCRFAIQLSPAAPSGRLSCTTKTLKQGRRARGAPSRCRLSLWASWVRWDGRQLRRWRGARSWCSWSCLPGLAGLARASACHRTAWCSHSTPLAIARQRSLAALGSPRRRRRLPPHCRLLSDLPLQGSRGRRSTFATSMLRCQALSVGRPGAGIAARPLRSAAARPQRCLVVAAAPPDGGSGQPPSSRRPASRLEPLPAAEQLGSSPRLGGAAPHSSGHHGAHGAGAAAAPAHPKASQAPVEPGSWEDWQRYFYEMDDVVNELESLYSEQEEAVAREDYRAAAALKAQREVRQGYRGLSWLSC